MLKKINVDFKILCLLSFILLIPILLTNLFIPGEYHFFTLAQAFTSGHLDIQNLPYKSDFAQFNGHYYSPLGPFPAILVAPFLLILKGFSTEAPLKIPLVIANFYLIFQIAKNLTSDKNKSLLLAIFYIFGSVLTPVEVYPFSTYFSQVVVTTLLLFAVWEFLNSQRYLLIGTAIALSFLTRGTTIFASLFFLIFLFKKPVNIKNALLFISPIIISICLFFAYNYLRFNSIFESGYKYQFINQQLEASRNIGIFSISHIPENLYTLFFKLPNLYTKFPFFKPDFMGMSIFILSPILFLLIKINFKEKYVKGAVLTILLILLPISLYYGIGFKQIGYRYALDFFPFILIILAQISRKIRFSTICLLVLISVLITFASTFSA